MAVNMVKNLKLQCLKLGNFIVENETHIDWNNILDAFEFLWVLKSHPRLIRSQYWGDSDYLDCVIMAFDITPTPSFLLPNPYCLLPHLYCLNRRPLLWAAFLERGSADETMVQAAAVPCAVSAGSGGQGRGKRRQRGLPDDGGTNQLFVPCFAQPGL